MSGEAQARYQRIKTPVGWSSTRDPWGWVTHQPGAWERSADGGRPAMWPPTTVQPDINLLDQKVARS